jgi:hypothetical protein
MRHAGVGTVDCRDADLLACPRPLPSRPGFPAVPLTEDCRVVRTNNQQSPIGMRTTTFVTDKMMGEQQQRAPYHEAFSSSTVRSAHYFLEPIRARVNSDCQYQGGRRHAYGDDSRLRTLRLFIMLIGYLLSGRVSGPSRPRGRRRHAEHTAWHRLDQRRGGHQPDQPQGPRHPVK